MNGRRTIEGTRARPQTKINAKLYNIQNVPKFLLEGHYDMSDSFHMKYPSINNLESHA